MAITFPLVTGIYDSFTNGPLLSKDVGAGPNRRAVVISGNGDPALTPTMFTIGADTISPVGALTTISLSRKFQAYISAADLTVEGGQLITPTFSGTSGGTSGSWTALMVIQGDAALTIDNILALIEQVAPGGGGGPVSRTVTTTTGDTAVLMVCEVAGGTGTPSSGSTGITSDYAATDAVLRVAVGASTALGLDYTAFGGGMSLAFAVREAGAGAPTLSGPTAPSVPEGTTTCGLITASEAGTFGALTGADALRFALTGVTSTAATLSFIAAPDFDVPGDVGGNNVYNVSVPFTATGSGLSATPLAVAVTVTNINESPVFVGGNISVPTLTVGVAMTPVELAGRWTDPESGALTYAPVGTWPAGVSIVGTQIVGTPSAAATSSGLTVTASDGVNPAVPSNTFSISVNAPVTYACTILDWVLPTASQHSVGEPWNISFHNVSTRALVAYAPAAALVAGVNGAGAPSRNLVVPHAAFVLGTTYSWFAEHPTNPTWFASGRATAA